MNKDLDTILDDVHQIGRGDATLDVDDWSELKPGVKKAILSLVLKALPEKLPEPSVVTDWRLRGYNEYADEAEANIRKVLG